MPEKSEAAMWGHGGDGRDWSAGGNSFSRAQYSTRRGEIQGPAHGQLLGDTWTKNARASQHQLRTPRAWALDCADLDAAERCGARAVHIRDLEALRSYWASVDIIRKRGFAFERGHGRQVALTLENWRPTRGEAEALTASETAAEAEPEPLAIQGVLPW